ncbi:MAG: hypothetical protein WBA10_18885, partial [Elainellaceae cyanobacterium]
MNHQLGTDFYTEQETRLRSDWGDAICDQVMTLPDDDEEQERAIKTVAVGGDRSNTERIFLTFQDRADVE